MPPFKSYTLVSVNKNPERATRIIARVTEDMKNEYMIDHIANCPTVEALPGILAEIQPEILVCSTSIRVWYCTVA